MTKGPIDVMTGQPIDTKDCWPKFYTKRGVDKIATRKEGRLIEGEVERVDVFIPGDKHTVFSREVTDEDRARWPAHYRAFKEGKADTVVGTPLEMIPGLTESQIGHLKYNHVMTAEQLASLGDAGIANLGMGAREMVNLAIKFMEASKDKALAAKNMAQEQQIKILMDRLAALEANQGERVEAEAAPGEILVPASEAPRRGRPPKVQHEAA